MFGWNITRFHIKEGKKKKYTLINRLKTERKNIDLVEKSNFWTSNTVILDTW